MESREKIETFSPEEMRQFLVRNGIEEGKAQLLFDVDFTGENFVSDVESREDYEELPIDLGVMCIFKLWKLRSKIVSNNKGETAKANKKSKESIRSFGFPVSSTLAYKEGNKIMHETASSNPLDPSREFKDFTGTESIGNPEEIKRIFLEKVTPFIIACLNRRCNGTIYLGVNDGGGVMGVDISKQGGAFFEDILDRYFRGEHPIYFKGCMKEMILAARVCISTVYVVPIENSRKVVLEIDIEPSPQECNSIVFYIIDESSGAKKFFIRGQTASRCITIHESIQPKDRKRLEELEKEVVYYNTYRLKKELALRREDSGIDTQLFHKVCRGWQSIRTSELKYVLICSGLEDIDNQFTWLMSMNWLFVYDFDSATRETGLFRAMENNPSAVVKMRFDNSSNLVKKFNAQMNHGLLNCDLGSGLFVCCNEYNRSERSFEDMDAWRSSCKIGIQHSFITMTRNERFEENENVVVIVVLNGEDNLNQIRETIIALGVKLDQLVFLCRDEWLSDKFAQTCRDSYGPSVKDQIIVAPEWSHVNTFMMNATGCHKTKDYQCICTSSGIEIQLENRLIECYATAGIDILASNQCDYLTSLEKSSLAQVCEEKVLSFLKGGICEWEVLYLATDSAKLPSTKIVSGYVERDLVSHIVKDLVGSAVMGDCRSVVRKQLAHEPGAGATTIARRVLWQLRKDMRCLIVSGRDLIDGDKIIQEKVALVAEQILEFRELHEPEKVYKGISADAKCRPVLVLLDDANEKLSEILVARLHGYIDNRGITVTAPLVLILYLNSTFNLRGALERGTENVAGERIYYSYCLPQSLSPLEVPLFKDKLDYLQASGDIRDMLSMLSFVIMAEDFNQDSIYVKSVVERAMIDMKDVYPNQRMLLLYLAILKKYSGQGLPAKHCERMIQSVVRNYSLQQVGKTCWDMLCPQAKLFLRVRSHNTHKAIEVSHWPVANQLCCNLLEGDLTLDSAVSQLLLEEVIVCERFQMSIVHASLRYLLVWRDVATSAEIPSESDALAHFPKEKYSKLILDINSSKSQQDAINVLEVGFHSLEKDQKSFIAQTIARMYIDLKNFDSAEKWAREAVSLSNQAFFMMDTLGQVFKWKGRHLNDVQNKDYSLNDSEDVIITASTAATTFRKVQELYMEYKKFRPRLQSLEKLDVESDSSTNLPGIIGEIETNLLAMEHILNAKELQGNDCKDVFLAALRNDDFSCAVQVIFLRAESWDWRSYIPFIKGLFQRTLECINLLTRKLAYIDIPQSPASIHTLSRLEKLLYQVEMTFADSDSFWEDFIRRKMMKPKDQLNYIRRFLVTGMTNSFVWLMRRRAKEIISKTHLKLVKKMLECANADKNLILSNNDKLSIISTFLASVYYACCSSQLPWDDLKIFCRELVAANLEVPEPYFFYMVLHWPKPNESLSENEEELLSWCSSKLSDFEESFGMTRKSEYTSSKARVIFFLREGDASDRLLSNWGTDNIKKAWEKAARLSGEFDANKDFVELTAQGGCKLRLRPASNYFRNTFVTRVSFNVGFTLGGPVAYNIKDDDKRAEMKRLRNESAE